MRAFIYCRVSTVEQGSDDHYSLANQEQRGRDYAKMKGWRAAKVRKDIASGKNDQRDGFQELLADVEAERIDAVVVYRLDRLSRNVRDIYDFLERLREKEVAFVSVTEGFDTTTAMGRAMLGVAAVFAQLTREMISENVRDGLLRKREDGYFVGNPHSVFGYEFDQGAGLLRIREDEAEQVRKIFRWYQEDKWGTVKIARALNVEGVPTKYSTQWKGTTIWQLIRNPLYGGCVRVEDGTVAGRHEGIITPEQFQATQELIRSRATLPPRSHQSRHLLSGLARCGKCGRRLRAHYTYHTLKSGERRTHIFYMHSKTAQVGQRGCPGLAKSARKLEAAVLGQIRAVAESGELQRLTVEAVRQQLGQSQNGSRQERDQLVGELAEMDERFNQWADRLDAGRIDEEQFDRQNRRLLKRKRQIQERLGALDQALGEEETLEVTLDEVKDALQDFPTVWETLTRDEQRETLRLLVEQLQVYKTYVDLKLVFLEAARIPFGAKARQ